MVYYLSTSLIGVTRNSPSGPVRCLNIEGTLNRWWESWWLLSPNETSDRFILLAFSPYSLRSVIGVSKQVSQESINTQPVVIAASA